MGKKLTVEEFIKKSKIKHGENKFNYSQVISLKSFRDKVILICNDCKSFFLQSPKQNLQGKGCKFCADIRFGNRERLTLEEFIQQSKNKYGENKFNYDKVQYKNYLTKVILICKDCKTEFEQKPIKHLSSRKKSVCKYCNKKSPSSTEEFIQRSKEIFKDNEFDYSKTIYKNTRTKICVICNNCQKECWQWVCNHLKGHGCNSCPAENSIGETEWLDYLKIPKENRNITLQINKKRFTPDGLVGNIVYEFNGDCWHGNPEIFNSEHIFPRIKKTYGELYLKTLEKERILKEAGYEVISIWASEWEKLKEKLNNNFT